MSAAQLEWKGVKESGLEWISLRICGKERKQVVWNIESVAFWSYSLLLCTAPSPGGIPENIHPTNWMGNQSLFSGWPFLWIGCSSPYRWLSPVCETHQLLSLFLRLPKMWFHLVNARLCVSVKEHGCLNRSFLSLWSLVLLLWEAKSPALSLSSF